VLIVLNDSDKPKIFSIKDKDNATQASLPAGAVGTFVWW
jgi:O-glycosyl hydrolase